MAPSALDVVVGSPGVVRQQVGHLKALVKQAPNIDLRIRRASSTLLPELGGPFIHLQFPEDNGELIPEMIYVETYLGAKYIEDAEKVREMSSLFESLMSQSTPIGEFL